MLDIGGLFNRIRNSKHLPDFLMGLGITSSIMAMVATAEGTVQSVKEIQKEEQVLERPLSKKEKAQKAFKNYIPAGILELVTIGCFLGADSAHRRNYATLAAGYGVAQTLIHEYREAIKETEGPDKEQTINEIVAKKIAEKRVQPSETNNLYLADAGTICWFYDEMSKNQVQSDVISMYKSIINLNYDNFTCEFTSVNDFYYAVGLPETDDGDEYGWNLIDGPIWPDFVPEMDNCGRLRFRIVFNGSHKPKPRRYS